MIQHLTIPGLPHLRFEYHPRTASVYAVWTSSTPHVGERIAEGIQSSRWAKRIIGAWIIGYRAGLREHLIPIPQDGSTPLVAAGPHTPLHPAPEISNDKT